MDYIRLGRSGLQVSRLCLGTMNFGPLTTPADSNAIMDRAHELGINFFDTANRYGGASTPPGQVAQNDESHSGWTEEIIGDWFASGGGRRERTVLATKLYGAMADWPNEGKLSALNIRRACDASLRRLRTDYIDLYQMHHIDRDTPWEEIWQAMEVLVAQGKILYVGSSNFAGWHIAQANSAAAARDFFGLVSEQSIYNLMTRQIELEVLPAAINFGVGVIPWSPLQGGLLGGVLKQEREGRRRLAGGAREAVERNREKIEAYESLCDEIGEEPASVALAWLLHQDGVTGPIIGPRTVGQLEGTERAVTLSLDGKVLERLDTIFPGYRPAPEHYAWQEPRYGDEALCALATNLAPTTTDAAITAIRALLDRLGDTAVLAPGIADGPPAVPTAGSG